MNTLQEAFKLLELKKEICARDLMYEFEITDQHSHRIIKTMEKYDNIVRADRLVYKSGRPYGVKFIKFKE